MCLDVDAIIQQTPSTGRARLGQKKVSAVERSMAPPAGESVKALVQAPSNGVLLYVYSQSAPTKFSLVSCTIYVMKIVQVFRFKWVQNGHAQR
jgi:hypothetical protein